MLTSADVERIARALTPDLLLPYVPPARPFVLGPMDRWGVRPGYALREEADGATAGAPVAESPPSTAVTRLAQALARAIAPGSLAVVDRTLEAAANPADPLTDARAATVALVTCWPRAFTLEGDDAGPPADAARLREWTLPELQRWLDVMGFEVLFGGLLPEVGGAPTAPIGALVVSAHTPAARATDRRELTGGYGRAGAGRES